MSIYQFSVFGKSLGECIVITGAALGYETKIDVFYLSILDLLTAEKEFVLLQKFRLYVIKSKLKAKAIQSEGPNADI